MFYGLSQFFLYSPVSPGFQSILWEPFYDSKLQMISHTPLRFTFLSAVWQDPCICLYLRCLLLFHCGQLEWQNPQDADFFLSCFFESKTVLLELTYTFISQNPTEFSMSDFLTIDFLNKKNIQTNKKQ